MKLLSQYFTIARLISLRAPTGHWSKLHSRRFLLRKFSRPGVGYWHDTGHAQIKENLGFISHALHLESLAGRLLGFHLHDVEFPGHDHRPPGRGMIDFAALKPWVKREHIKVFELSPRLTEEEARQGVAHLKQLWGEE